MVVTLTNYLIFQFLQSIISSAQADTPSPFVEKFKYNVISSSLLSPALPAPYSRRSSRYLSVPGKLHSRASSMDLDHGIPITPVPPSEPFYGVISLSTASVAILFSAGYPFFAWIALIVTLLLLYNFFSTTDSHQSDTTMTAVRTILLCLNFLADAYHSHSMPSTT